MKQVVIDSLAHPVTSAFSGTGAAVTLNQTSDGSTVSTVMQIITFVVGVLPGILNLFKRKKKKVQDEN